MTSTAHTAAEAYDLYKHAFEADALIQSETEIMGSAVLKQRVIDKLGLARIYPKLAAKYDTDLVNAARWVLSRYNLGTPSQEATAVRALEADPISAPGAED